MDFNSRYQAFRYIARSRIPISEEIKVAVLVSSINPYIFRASHKGTHFVDLVLSSTGANDLTTNPIYANPQEIAIEHSQARVSAHDYGYFWWIAIEKMLNALPQEFLPAHQNVLRDHLTRDYLELCNQILRSNTASAAKRHSPR